MKIETNIFPIVINEVNKTSEIIMGKNYKKTFGQELAERQKENEEASERAKTASDNSIGSNTSSIAYSLLYTAQLSSIKKKSEDKLNINIRGDVYEK